LKRLFFYVIWLIVLRRRSRRVLLAHQLEGALLGLVTLCEELLDRLQASRMLLLAYNATLPGLHEVLLGQPTGSVLCRAVKHLALGANRDLRASHHIILASRVHIYNKSIEINLVHGKSRRLTRVNSPDQILHFT